jgi:hypothetical protein
MLVEGILSRGYGVHLTPSKDTEHSISIVFNARPNLQIMLVMF